MDLTPKVLPETKPFWDAAAEERLMIQRCKPCARHYFPPGPICPHCSQTDADWVQVSGRAKLFSFVLTPSPWPQWKREGLVSVVSVTLEEGPRLLSTVVDCEQTAGALKLDMELTATWRPFGDGPKLLCFRPQTKGAQG
jgi:uncharacterized protein